MIDRAEDPLAAPRLAGRLAGERFDAALRERERRERAELLVGRRRAGEDGEPAGLSGEADGEVWRLRQRVAELAAFHHAVVRSRAWRLVQALRRPLGRAW